MQLINGLRRLLTGESKLDHRGKIYIMTHENWLHLKCEAGKELTDDEIDVAKLMIEVREKYNWIDDAGVELPLSENSLINLEETIDAEY